MTKEQELLQKMDLSEENLTKLQNLLEDSRKSGKILSKVLIDTLDSIEATEDQIDTFYDVLEIAGIEIDVSDVLEMIDPANSENPTLAEMQAIEDEIKDDEPLDVTDWDEDDALPISPWTSVKTSLRLSSRHIRPR